MINIDILKCELAKLVYLYTGKASWGLECDLEDLICKINSLYNYIAIIDNASNCAVSSVVWNNIFTCQQQLQATSPTSLCRNC